MNARHLLAVTLMCALPGALTAQDDKPGQPVDAAAKVPAPAALLDAARTKAIVDNKRLLVVYRDDDAEATAAWEKALKGSREVAHLLLYDFSVLTLDATKAADLATRHGIVPDQLPAFAVIDPAGKVLARGTAADFMADGKLDGKKLADVLAPHVPLPMDAGQVFIAAMTDAKKTGRRVLIHFGAPVEAGAPGSRSSSDAPRCGS